MKRLKYAYLFGFLSLTLFGIYYYTQALQPIPERTPITSNSTVSRSFKIEGMYCESCKQSIETKVSKINGVQSVTVNQDTNEMIVVYNQNQESIKETLDTVNALGYSAGLKSNEGKLQVMDFNIRFQ